MGFQSVPWFPVRAVRQFQADPKRSTAILTYITVNWTKPVSPLAGKGSGRRYLVRLGFPQGHSWVSRVKLQTVAHHIPLILHADSDDA